MKVIGIGGIFFKSEQAEKLMAWYKDQLGINSFAWKEVENKALYHTVLNPLPQSSNVFDGANKNLVISYIVDDLEGSLVKLKKEGIAVNEKVDDRKKKSASIVDPEGNKFILREAKGNASHIATTPLDKVTGLGGVFFKSSDPKGLGQWYAEHLGLPVTKWGCSFLWSDPNNPNEKEPATTVWNPFGADTKYFNPSTSDFMFNFRVLNLVELLKTLEASRVQLAGTMEEFSYGKFGWIIDPDGNKIELWEPVDGGF